MEPFKNNESINSFLNNSAISITNEQKRDITITVTGPLSTFKAFQTDKKFSIITSAIEPKRTYINQESLSAKQLSKSDAQSFENNLSLNTEKELSSPSSSLKKMMGALGKGIGNIGKGIGSGLGTMSKGLGLNTLGKGLNNLSKLGLDQLGKGWKDISKGLNLRKLQENLKKMAF